MKVSSFDIFDTCLARKCGTPENMLDVLSLRVFRTAVDERVRESFVVERRKAEERQWEQNPYVKLADIYRDMHFAHEALYDTKSLVEIETKLEDELLVPVLSIRDKINSLRDKGHHIIYISDMYLPEEFIRKKMSQYGFLQEGDSLYVSCEVGRRKSDGKLFEEVHECEKIAYNNWRHYGDSYLSDYCAPRHYGIRAKLIKNKQNPYPQRWVDQDFSTTYKYPSILAGLSSALSVSNVNNSHRDFVLDLIAPFYCSWIYQVLKQAEVLHYTRLYFLARDAYMMYHIALQMKPLFPKIECKYLYMSRKSLYEGNKENRLRYFEQEGLATKNDNVAVVDSTTCGRTIKVLNDELVANGYNAVGNFYYQLWAKIDDIHFDQFNTMIYYDYAKHNKNIKYCCDHYCIYETFYALNTQKKTIDYVLKDGKMRPVFERENAEITINDQAKWEVIHRELCEQYVRDYINLGLYHYSRQIFYDIVIPTMIEFFKWPEKQYVLTLQDFYSTFERFSTSVPCVKHQPFWKVIFKKDRNYYWRRGTIVLSTPSWLLRMARYFKHV